MKLILDFDDVIFDTRAFVADYKKIFFANGISAELFEKNYKAYPEKNPGGDLQVYDPERHLEALARETGLDMAKIKKEIEIFVGDTKKYVFDDVVDFLEKFSRDDLILLSFGKSDFQKKKIENSGIEKFFGRIEITNRMKGELLEEIEDKNIFFFDDRVEQIDSVKNKFSNIKTFLVKRLEGRYDDQPSELCDFVVKSLQEAKEMILEK